MNAISRRDLLKAGMTLGVVSCCNPFVLAEDAKPDPYADGVLVDGVPAPVTPGAFTVVVLPDIQNYTERRPEIAKAQTDWILENAEARNIAWVCQLGDLTNHNLAKEYVNAAAALKALDGRVPYSFVTGNHDYGAGGKCQDRTTLVNDYFPVKDYRSMPTFGGTYDKEPESMTNSYHRFSAGGRKFLVLALEFGPRHDVVRWANDVVSRNADHEVILTTHAYLHSDGTREDWARYGDAQRWNPHRYAVAKNNNQDVMDGEELWNNLICKHENFVLTMNGHVLEDGLGRLVTSTPSGRDVQQMVVNFQMRPNGGDGWLRLLEFQPESRVVRVGDYSPTRRQRNESTENKFEMQTAPIL
ncbi:metallophosphoesterase [Planctomicrobium sp. SH664]|uniref:metallophosphoesterase n=1 Tax=Planctomicrobium sp. SH664 TaxID=3448125 RepID=UPI003F5B6537